MRECAGQRLVSVVLVEGKAPPAAATYANGGWSQLGGYALRPYARASTAPATGDFVRTIVPTRTHVVAMAITFPSDCALGAMSDLLGKRPQLDQPVDASTGTILAPDKRPQIQDLLVRDGAEVMLAVVRLKRSGKADEILAATTCGPTDLGACVTAFDALGDASALEPGPDLPDYNAIATATDTRWSVTTFEKASLVIAP